MPDSEVCEINVAHNNFISGLPGVLLSADVAELVQECLFFFNLSIFLFHCLDQMIPVWWHVEERSLNEFELRILCLVYQYLVGFLSGLVVLVDPELYLHVDHHDLGSFLLVHGFHLSVLLVSLQLLLDFAF